MLRISGSLFMATLFACETLTVSQPALAIGGTVPFSRLANDATLIVAGRVIDRRFVPAPAIPQSPEAGSSGRELMLTRIRLTDVVKGEAAGTTIVVESRPGVEDEAQFDDGECVLLFLVSAATAGHYRTVALAQGKLTIVDGDVPSRRQSYADVIATIRNSIERDPP